MSRDKSRWATCAHHVNEMFSMAVGRMFIEQHFKKQTKTNVSVVYMNSTCSVL